VASLESYISQAEIAYKSGNCKQAIKYARFCLAMCSNENTITAVKIFIARGYSKLGKLTESNCIYRQLINEKIYLPPVIMGLLYNSIRLNENIQKANRNLGLIKLYIR